MRNDSINLKLVAISLIAIFLTFFFHESAHYVMGRLLGYDMWMNMNSAGLLNMESYKYEWQDQLVSISGPVFTIVQGIVFFVIIKKTKDLKWYPFLFIAALMRVFASIISSVGMANDEARVSEWLNIGKMTLPIIVSVFLISLVIKTSINNRIKWQFNLALFGIMSLGITAIVLLNQYI